ncbi:TRAP transporter large permease [Hydromonas duriensis]|uniref:Tripartite ATP-independent transporter DctM subunit n=1 Tax=Hydromonas duriensis TaxID=1527608 RepID=A0A4R6Y9R1_9BURK|nr:TRAP transporter large permease subunit [Hydromonas duriensis]TDR32201.1 tripartite ATP-independent transporter DctM subunit [Hydromonas duriensis]
MELLAANLAPIMFLGLIAFMLSGFPITFSLAANGLLFAAIGIGLGILNPNLMQALPNRVYGIMMNDTLLAIPFFTFMGLILERSGMAEDLLDTIGQLFGPVRGGLAYAVILVGALLAATTGVVAASVIAMGLISLPLMLKYGYDKRVAAGTIAASGTLAQIIPPSLVLIVLASQLGRPVGDLYKAAFTPGFILVGLYLFYILIVSIVKPSWVPALPLSARTFKPTQNGRSGAASLLIMVALAVAVFYTFFSYSTQGVSETHKIFGADTIEESFGRAKILALSLAIFVLYGLAKADQLLKLHVLSDMTQRVIFVLVPPLALIFLVLGTVFMGIATPTEGGGLGALGAILLAMSKGKLNLGLTKQAMESTLKLTSFVLFILIGSTVFNLVFQGVKGDKWVEHLLTAIPGGQIGFLIVVNLLFFVLAFFLEFFELSFILVPLIAPVAEKLGIDLVWFGVLLAVNMQTSFMHPPFGFALFYLRSVAPKSVKTSDIYLGAIPYVVIQLIVVALIIIFPNIVVTDKSKSNGTTPAILNSTGVVTPALNLDMGNKTGSAAPKLSAPILDVTQPAAADSKKSATETKSNEKSAPKFDFVPTK